MTSPTSGLAEVNGIELYYQLRGTGKPLVLLHGGFGSVEMFGPNVEALAAGRQVIGVDLLSHGRTPAVDRPMRFETMADDVAALIRYLGHECADVMVSRSAAGSPCARRSSIRHRSGSLSSSRPRSSGTAGTRRWSPAWNRWGRRSPNRTGPAMLIRPPAGRKLARPASRRSYAHQAIRDRQAHAGGRDPHPPVVG